MSLTWMRQGACHDRPWPEMWFQNNERSGVSLIAVDICKTCPVMAECAEYAIDRPELVGIWGATTTLQRQKARRRKRVVA